MTTDQNYYLAKESSGVGKHQIYWGYGAPMCFVPEFFGVKFPENFGDFLKTARGGFFDPLEGMWDHSKTFEHRLDTLTTPPASLCGPKGSRKPWIPEIFGKTTLNFW